MDPHGRGPKRWPRFLIIGLGLLFLGLVAIVACRTSETSSSSPSDLLSIAAARGLSPEDAVRAVKTFVAPGKYDDYLLFASGGHSGQIHVFGVPSMRLLKTIAVFTPDPWQGYGYGSDWSEEVFADASPGNTRLLWGDSHHPALSETDGKYDGRWIYINDRAHGRIAMVDLADFRTKQILSIPNIQTSHGGIFTTPDTRYVHISSMVPALRGWDARKGGEISVKDHLERYGEVYRGYSTFLRVRPEDGRLDLEESFQIELPPYTQDLADAGKGPSYGWAFINSFNAEMATGGTEYGRPPLEAGASQLDFDFLHLINWIKAEEVIAAGKFQRVNGMRVIPLETAVAEGLLFFAPEPRSPHGVDVAPRGDYMAISGKLDPHVTVYGMDRILAAIEAEDFEGHGYTSLFLESAVAKWSLGEPYHPPEDTFKLVDKVSIHYNIGHLATAQGDTMEPLGKYLVALNKWSIDRHPKVGPLHPQNFQLVDLSGEKMELLADLPIGVGEPHYAQLVKADVIKGLSVYPPGTSARTMAPSPNAIASAEEARIERRPGEVEVWMSVVRSHFKPDIIPAKVGDRVIVHLTNQEQTPDATHGFAIPTENVMVSLDPGETTTVEFTASTPGAFSFYCTEFCSALHLEMQGWLIVEKG